MKGTNAVTKFLGHIENGEHLIGAVAVHVYENVAAQRACQGIEFEVARRGGVVRVAPMRPKRHCCHPAATAASLTALL